MIRKEYKELNVLLQELLVFDPRLESMRLNLVDSWGYCMVQQVHHAVKREIADPDGPNPASLV
nr:hypothetical protein [Hymenobacter sp. HDW8]